MRKKLHVLGILSICIALFLVSGCSFEEYRTGIVNKLTNTSDAQLAAIWDGVVNKDEEAIKSLFAKNALEQAQNLEDGIAYILNMPEGEIKEIDHGGGSSGSNDYGEKVLTSDDYKTISIDGHRYEFYISHTVTDTKNPDNVGLWTLQIIDLEEVGKTVIKPENFAHDYVGIYIGEYQAEDAGA